MEKGEKWAIVIKDGKAAFAKLEVLRKRVYAGGKISAQVAALAEGALNALLLNKLKITLVLVAVIAVVETHLPREICSLWLEEAHSLWL